MKFLKPLFFKKYRPTQIYTYSSNWENISFNYKGKHLSTLLFKANHQKTKGIVILVHPMKIEGKYFFIEAGHAKLYTENGYHVIIFDFNGFGESEDRDFHFDKDLNEVIFLTKKIYPNLPIYIHGVSMGGAQTVLSANEQAKHIQAIIIESAASSNIDYYKHRGRKKLVNIINFFDFLFPTTNKKHLYYNQIKQLKNTPKLFIYGKKDNITPLWMGEKIYHNALEPKQMKIFDTEHLTTISEVEVEYKQLVLDFFERTTCT